MSLVIFSPITRFKAITEDVADSRWHAIFFLKGCFTFMREIKTWATQFVGLKVKELS